MGSYQIKSEILENIKNRIDEIKTKFSESLKDKKETISTEEFFKINFYTNMLEDVEFLNELTGSDLFKIRHANLIIRNIIEQLIEFMYLIKNKNMIADYLGENYNFKEPSLENCIEENFIKEIRKLGSKRFTKNRKHIADMAKDIGENQPNLYNLYQFYSEDCHNSYFLVNLDTVEEIEFGEKRVPLTKEQVVHLLIVLGYLIDTL